MMTKSQEDRSEIITALTADIDLSQDEESEKNEKRYIFGKTSEQIAKYPCVYKMVQIISLVNLILFAFTTVLTGLFIGLSWNHYEKYKVDSAMVSILLSVSVVIFSFFICLFHWR